MALHWFSCPVYVKTEQPGLTSGVSLVEGAAEELLKWASRGPKWRRAVQACMDAIEGGVSPGEVRKAFEAAAREAGKLAHTVPRLASHR